MGHYKGIAGRRVGKAKGVVPHNDSGSKNANVKFYKEWLKSHNPELGFAHVYIAEDGRYQLEDYENKAWHTATTEGNTWYVGWEACQSQGDEAVFLNNEQRMFEDIAKFMKSGGLVPGPSTVKLHREFSSTSCPHRSWALHGQSVEAVRSYYISQILKYMGGATVPVTPEKPATPSTPTVTTPKLEAWNKRQSVDTDGLRVRKSPTTKSDVIATLSKGHKFTATRIARSGERIEGYTTWFEVGDGVGKGGFVSGAYTTEVPATTTTTATKMQVVLPKTATSWYIYPLAKAPVVGNQIGALNPSKFGGLTYDLIRWSQTNVAVIKTYDFGEVQIYVGSETGAKIVNKVTTTTPAPSNPVAKVVEIVHLPKTATRWGIYKKGVQPVVKNIFAYIYPSRFNGLSYEVKGWSQKDVALIETRDYGIVQIYVASSTGAKITKK